MRSTFSERAERIAKAEIRSMTVECERLGGINLAQGVCDMEVPEPVRRAAQTAIERGINSYTRHDGLAELRQAIARKMLEFNSIEVDAETGVVASAGATGALYCACLALLDPGDEVLLLEPYYGYHLSTLAAVDAVARFVRMDPPDWSFQIERIEELVTPQTKAILLNTPGNPTGKVLDESELAEIARVALENDLFIFSDEIYEYFVYDGLQHRSIGALPDVADRTITISGYSKTFSITGWRIGYCVGDPRWLERIGHVNDLVYVCAPAPLQVGVAEGIDVLGPEYYSGLVEELGSRRAMICEALRRSGFGLEPPQGAYYVLADAGHLPGSSSKDRALNLLRAAGVATVPGSDFVHDDSGEHLLRFCYARPLEQLEAACERLMRFAKGGS